MHLKIVRTGVHLDGVVIVVRGAVSPLLIIIILFYFVKRLIVLLVEVLLSSFGCVLGSCLLPAENHLLRGRGSRIRG